jgi:hypothetical protein
VQQVQHSCTTLLNRGKKIKFFLYYTQSNINDLSISLAQSLNKLKKKRSLMQWLESPLNSKVQGSILFPKFSFFSFSLDKMDEKNVTPKQLLQASCP